MKIFIFLSLLSSSVWAGGLKCTIGDDVFQTQITYAYDNESIIKEFTVQKLLRGQADGEPKTMQAEMINNYHKGWTYRVHLLDDFYGIIDVNAGRGSVYVNLIFGQSSSGICRPVYLPDNQ